MCVRVCMYVCMSLHRKSVQKKPEDWEGGKAIIWANSY